MNITKIKQLNDKLTLLAKEVQKEFVNGEIPSVPDMIAYNEIMLALQKAEEAVDTFCQEKKKPSVKVHQHTPGPWELEKGLMTTYIQTTNRKHVIAKTCNDNVQALVDAKLICAAPDLLHASEVCLEWINNVIADDSFSTCANLLSDAIQKAKYTYTE